MAGIAERTLTMKPKLKEVITYKLDKDKYQKLEVMGAPALSASLVARDIVVQVLQSGKSPKEEPEAPSLARALWLLITKLNPEVKTEEATELVRYYFLDPRNSPPFKSNLGRALWLLIMTLSEEEVPENAATLVSQCFEEGLNAPEFNR